MPVTENKRRSLDAYNSKCDNIIIKPLQPVGADIRAAAAAAGQSVQGYILQAIRDRMERDGFVPSAVWPCNPRGSNSEDSAFPPFRLVASFSDGSRLLFDGISKAAARTAMESAQAEHGDITWWDGVTDEHYKRGRYFAALPEPPEGENR